MVRFVLTLSGISFRGMQENSSEEVLRAFRLSPDLELARLGVEPNATPYIGHLLMRPGNGYRMDAPSGGRVVVRTPKALRPSKRQSSLLAQIQPRARGLSFNRIDTPAQLPGCGRYAVCFCPSLGIPVLEDKLLQVAVTQILLAHIRSGLSAVQLWLPGRPSAIQTTCSGSNCFPRIGLAPGLEPALPARRHRRSGSPRCTSDRPGTNPPGARLGYSAQQPRLHLVADDEHRRRGAVVGAAVGIFRDAPAKFAERHHQHARQVPLRLHILDERLHRIAQVLAAIAPARWPGWCACRSRLARRKKSASASRRRSAWRPA